MKIGIIGAGKVGTTLAIVFKKNNFDVIVASKHKESADRVAQISGAVSLDIMDAAKADIVFLSVPDAEIVNVSQYIKNVVNVNQIIVHLSGALSSSIISFLNANTCSIHPLKSFADPLIAANTMEGTLFTFEGSSTALKILEPIIEKIHCTVIKIRPEDKPLYHLAAVFVANYTVTLFDISQRMLKSIGFSGNEAKSALLSLVSSVVQNIETQDAEGALTGPILRGDYKTVELHLACLKDKNLKTIYKSLAFATLKIAEKRGLNKNNIEKIREVLNG